VTALFFLPGSRLIARVPPEGLSGEKAAGRKKLLIIPESLQKRLVISADEYYLINWNAE
jgi:hypothetical protein